MFHCADWYGDAERHDCGVDGEIHAQVSLRVSDGYSMLHSPGTSFACNRDTLHQRNGAGGQRHQHQPAPEVDSTISWSYYAQREPIEQRRRGLALRHAAAPRGMCGQHTRPSLEPSTAIWRNLTPLVNAMHVWPNSCNTYHRILQVDLLRWRPGRTWPRRGRCLAEVAEHGQYIDQVDAAVNHNIRADPELDSVRPGFVGNCCLLIRERRTELDGSHGRRSSARTGHERCISTVASTPDPCGPMGSGLSAIGIGTRHCWPSSWVGTGHRAPRAAQKRART